MPFQETEVDGSDPGTAWATATGLEDLVESEADRRASGEGRFVVPVVVFARGGTDEAQLARGAARAVGWVAASAGGETVA